MPKIEIACFNPVSAIIAFENGADRIEFCDGLNQGGTTPNFETTKQIRGKINIPIFWAKVETKTCITDSDKRVFQTCCDYK